MRNIIISATLLLVMATAVSCKSKTGEAETAHEVLAPNAIEMNAAQFKSAGIQVSTPGERSIRGVIKVNGLINVTPQNIATVSAPLGGFVKSTTPVQGSQVTKGEVLAMVENMAFIELEQAYLETKARSNWNRPILRQKPVMPTRRSNSTATMSFTRRMYIQKTTSSLQNPNTRP